MRERGERGELLYCVVLFPSPSNPQVYHMCNSRGGGRAFLCPEGTRFNQKTLVCVNRLKMEFGEREREREGERREI